MRLLYHETSVEDADAIVREGFRDVFSAGENWAVSVADRDPGRRGGPRSGCLVIEAELSDEEPRGYEFNKHQWLVNGYNEWRIPGKRINGWPRSRLR